MNISDIMVYFQSGMNPNLKEVIRQRLARLDGVYAPRFAKNMDKVLIVTYNPDKIDTSHFRETFTRMGLEGKFVGL